MKKFLPYLSLLLFSVCFAEPLKTVFNPFTGKSDYITRIDSHTVLAGNNCTSTSNSTGTVTINCGGGGSTAGGTNGQVQFNNGGAFGGDAALTYSSTTSSGLSISSFTVGDVFVHTTFNTTDGLGAYGMTIQALVDNARVIRISNAADMPSITFDMENRRVGFFTNTPSKSVEMNSDVLIDGTMTSGSGIRIPGNAGIFSFQGTATLVGGSAVVSNAIIDSNWNVYMTIQSPSGTVGSLYISSVTANSTFNVLSTSALDNSTFSWLMVEH